jgi:hypothetical protein
MKTTRVILLSLLLLGALAIFGLLNARSLDWWAATAGLLVAIPLWSWAAVTLAVGRAPAQRSHSS